MTLDEATAMRLRAAFPAHLEIDVRAAMRSLVATTPDVSANHIGLVTVGGEAICVPYRVYFAPEPLEAMPPSNSNAATILACIYSRHCDGRVREVAIRRVLAGTADWIPPFVVQLLGEYVLEIAQAIARESEALCRPAYDRFVRDNPTFIARTRRRATSYWNEYYRGAYPRLARYPALELLARMEGRA